jgi:hypothetical protein
MIRIIGRILVRSSCRLTVSPKENAKTLASSSHTTMRRSG